MRKKNETARMDRLVPSTVLAVSEWPPPKEESVVLSPDSLGTADFKWESDSDKAVLEETSEEAEARKNEAGGKCIPGPASECIACQELNGRDLTSYERSTYMASRMAYHRSTMIGAVPDDVVELYWRKGQG